MPAFVLERNVVWVRVLFVFLAVSAALASSASADDTVIRVLSNRADLLSGGDALVEVSIPPGVDPASAVLALDGVDVTAQFAVRPDGRFLAVLTGLDVGENALTVTLPDATGAALTLTSHPIEGPVFSGPHLVPWACTRAGADANCNAPPIVTYHYQHVATPGSFLNYDPANPPSPLLVRQITTDHGATVPYIVRQEAGSLNRGVYSFAVLHEPGTPLLPWEPPPGWNGKLLYPFGESCNPRYSQGEKNPVLDNRALSRGFAVATTSLNDLGQHCDTLKSAESVMMLKELLIERIGEIRYAFGEGLSGGSIGQYQVANAYPGLLQGLITAFTYPDLWTTAMDVIDCVLLDAYWNGPGYEVFTNSAARLAVEGHGASTVCPSWIALFAQHFDPHTGCDAGAPDYDPASQPDGCRATIQDIQVNVWGRRAEDGFAKRPYTNEGVQFGLSALNGGDISVEQFLHLNENLGGLDIDGEPTSERARADAGASAIAYATARIDDARFLDRVAIIDMPSPENADIHTGYHAFSIEARLVKAHGGADNHAIWRGGVSDGAAPAFAMMDAWLAAVEADATAAPLAAKIVQNRPAAAQDSCFVAGNQVFDETACDAAWPYYASTRIAAGSPFEKDVIQCALVAPKPGDYAVAFDTAQWQRLLDAFPTGVCDWSQSGIGQAPSQPWVSYANGPGGEPLGPPPVSTPLPEPGAFALAAGAGLVAALRRRRLARSGSERGGDEAFEIGDRAHRLDVFVGHLDVERLLERHHHLDHVERVGAQIIEDVRLGPDLGRLEPELRGQYRSDLDLDPVTHASTPQADSRND